MNRGQSVQSAPAEDENVCSGQRAQEVWAAAGDHAEERLTGKPSTAVALPVLEPAEHSVQLVALFVVEYCPTGQAEQG